MKTYILKTALLLACLIMVNGCIIPEYRVWTPAPQVVYQPVPPPPPAVIVQPQPSIVVETVMVPDSYFIVDGLYMGIAGNNYFYLGIGGVWHPCQPHHITRFHEWQHHNPHWRNYVIINRDYRRDRDGREHPRRDQGHNGSRH